ncbi:hypothetical protein ACFZAT_27460 [Streptomyces sp. NPDC008163]
MPLDVHSSTVPSRSCPAGRRSHIALPTDRSRVLSITLDSPVTAG